MVHDRTNEHVTSPPTCTENGILEYTCPSCSQVFTETLLALGHDYQEFVIQPGCETMGYTKHVCSRCDNAYIDLQRDPLGHRLVGTSNGDGTWTVTCERGCGYSAITTYDPATHTSCDATLATRTVAATCVRSGSIETYCTVCDRVTASTFLPALGHNLVDKDAKAATCCESGHNAYQVCTRCSYHTYQEIPALGHSNAVNDTDGDGWSVVIAATETMSGRRYKICDSCGVIYAEEIIPKTTASKKENE